jgi:hypothetical protein
MDNDSAAQACTVPIPTAARFEAKCGKLLNGFRRVDGFRRVAAELDLAISDLALGVRFSTSPGSLIEHVYMRL